jgi:hypothetical protein
MRLEQNIVGRMQGDIQLSTHRRESGDGALFSKQPFRERTKVPFWGKLPSTTRDVRHVTSRPLLISMVVFLYSTNIFFNVGQTMV